MQGNKELPMRIFTGSTSDVPEWWAQKHNVKVKPTYINCSDEVLIDTPALSLKYVFEKSEHSTRETFPTTAAPGPEKIKEFWGEYEGPILPIHAGHKLSSWFDSAVTAQRELSEQAENGRNNIEIPIETNNVSFGEGIAVMVGQQAIENGDSEKETRKKIIDAIPFIHMFSLPGRLDYLYKGGRATGIQSVMGSILKLRPLVYAYDNQIVPFKNFRTYSSAIEDLADWVAASQPIKFLGVLHTGDVDKASTLLQAIRARVDLDPDTTFLEPARNACSLHNGPDTVALAFLGSVKGHFKIFLSNYPTAPASTAV
jgi:DegV family protein with EDD domain